MAKIKFVTSYYMDITEFTNNRWIGSYPSRKQRYLASIIYHCKNLPKPIWRIWEEIRDNN